VAGLPLSAAGNRQDGVFHLDVTWLEGLDPELFRSLKTPEDFERFHHAFPAQR
jgi:hypothetical protein